jgi:hypothetical protein
MNTAEIQAVIDAERRRCVGLVLEAYALAKLSGADGSARILDRLATVMEHGHAAPTTD